MTRRPIGVLTTGRQDWGILRSTCRLLRDDPDFDLRLFAGGMHFATRFGATVRMIEEEGFRPSESLRWIADDRESDAHDQAGEVIKLIGAALARQKVEALILVGDRLETIAAALAATLACVPLIHLHGGEESEGAFDNAIRHAVTKLSHLHLVSHADHAARVIAMGEDPATVHVVGAPGLDNLHRADLPSRSELEARLGLVLAPPVVVVTCQPATLSGDPAAEANAVAAAMDAVDATYVVTLPNSDPGSGAVREIMARAATGRAKRVAVEALGERNFWGLLRVADAMLGNSSSALIEAPALALPSVNVGDRQKGRLRGANVIDTPSRAEAIAAALAKALRPEFRASLVAASPFGDGKSGARIVEVLRAFSPPHPPVKIGVWRK